jgi:hypothetical protein
MSRIVLPPVTAADVVDAIAAIDVGIAIEIVVVINVDVVAAPTSAPTPTAAPGGAHGQTNSERNRTGGNHSASRIRRIIDRRIGIHRRTINVGRIV